METLEVVIRSEGQEIFKTRRDAIQEGMMSIEKSLRILLARRAGKLKQGKILRLQVQNGHGSLQKFQEEIKIIHEAYDGMDDELEEGSPEFPVEEKLYNRVSQNAPKCLLASIEVHVAVSIPQEPPKKIW